jgi:hypothetical protein
MVANSIIPNPARLDKLIEEATVYWPIREGAGATEE